MVSGKWILIFHYLCNKYRISTIKCHRELKATSSPGQNFPLTEVKSMVCSILGSNRSFDTYTVKEEDTLWFTSKSFNMTVNELMNLNGLKDSSGSNFIILITSDFSHK